MPTRYTVKQSETFSTFWITCEVSRVHHCSYSGFMDDFGNLVRLDFVKFAIAIN